MSARTDRTLAALERAFLAIDRGLGGANPPPAPQAFAARYPTGCAMVAALLVAIPVGLAFAPFRAILVGTCAWLLSWAFLRLERRRQAHYSRVGYDTAPRDSWSTARPRAVLADMLLAWGPATVFVRLVGRIQDDPPSWTASAVFGALFVVGGYFGDRLKERRRARARARTAADQELG
ncbi:hypothetical protein [Streptomyces sp. NBC_01518]|uniref:hypothetical protein n=1 Tax=Streptomyces sp. NBC_01518 TaxID=2903891 RepID=UPI00386CC407